MKGIHLAGNEDNDSGVVLSELIGAAGFDEKVTGLSATHLVQQGAELAYLRRHDPEFRRVCEEHLAEAGRRVRLKRNIELLAEFFKLGVDGYRFTFYVVSAAPKEVIRSARDGIVSADHIRGTELEYDPASGEISAIANVPAGYGKVAVLEELEAELQISPDHTIYIGDGGSDIHVMLRVNRRDDFTIAVSEAKHIARIARRTVLSDTALSFLEPILKDVVGWNAQRIRELFKSRGLVLQEWDKARTDWLTISRLPRIDPELAIESAAAGTAL